MTKTQMTSHKSTKEYQKSQDRILPRPYVLLPHKDHRLFHSRTGTRSITLYHRRAVTTLHLLRLIHHRSQLHDHHLLLHDDLKVKRAKQRSTKYQLHFHHNKQYQHLRNHDRRQHQKRPPRGRHLPILPKLPRP